MSRLSGARRREARAVGWRVAVVLAMAIVPSCTGDTGTAEGGGAYIAGESYFSPSGYVEYIAGDSPVLLTAPHGGYLRPELLPDRQLGDTGDDDFTQELVRSIDTALVLATGRHPHVVICRLHRVKLDCNRDLEEAAEGNAAAAEVWAEYHALIDSAKARIVAEFGSGLMLDMHGHGRPIDRIELGYALTGEQVDLSDEILAQPTWVDSTSVRWVQILSGVDLATLLRGVNGLGTLLGARGYPSVPSQDIPGPGGDPYFTGGYNTRRHGSQEGGTISAVQVELYRPGLRDSDEARAMFAAAMVEALEVYFLAHFNQDLE